MFEPPKSGQICECPQLLMMLFVAGACHRHGDQAWGALPQRAVS
jgi:hypothetical protein